MTDYFFNVIPRDPNLVPAVAETAAVKSYVQSQFAPEDVEVQIHDMPQIIIGGEVEHILLCPLCGEDHTDLFFSEVFEQAYKDEGFNLEAEAPCSGKPINLNDIVFTHPDDPKDGIIHTGGFSKWAIKFRNPNREPIKQDIDEMSSRLKSLVKVVAVII